MLEARKLRDSLEALKSKLPGDHPAPIINDKMNEMRFETFREFIEHHEFGLALDCLVYVAEAHIEFGNNHY